MKHLCLLFKIISSKHGPHLHFSLLESQGLPRAGARVWINHVLPVTHCQRASKLHFIVHLFFPFFFFFVECGALLFELLYNGDAIYLKVNDWFGWNDDLAHKQVLCINKRRKHKWSEYWIIFFNEVVFFSYMLNVFSFQIFVAYL